MAKFERLDPDERARQIVLAAASIAESGGLMAINHKVVAAKAGCSVPTVSLYAGTKSNLIKKAVEHVLENSEGKPRAHLESILYTYGWNAEKISDAVNTHKELNNA
ncbi:MAG: hypothetical protein ACN2B6_12215 [Rickettsiales bacterium]